MGAYRHRQQEETDHGQEHRRRRHHLDAAQAQLVPHPFTFTTYTLTADELATQSGLLHQSFDTVKLFRIVDITISRTLLQRIFGLSTILIDAMDQSTGGKIVLKNIIDGFAVRKELQHAVDAARNVNRVSTREFMGTGDGYYGGPDGPDLDGDGYPDFPAR